MVVSMEYRARSFGFRRFPPGIGDRRPQAQSVHSNPHPVELRCFGPDRTREGTPTRLTIPPCPSVQRVPTDSFSSNFGCRRNRSTPDWSATFTLARIMEGLLVIRH